MSFFRYLCLCAWGSLINIQEGLYCFEAKFKLEGELLSSIGIEFWN